MEAANSSPPAGQGAPADTVPGEVRPQQVAVLVVGGDRAVGAVVGTAEPPALVVDHRSSRVQHLTAPPALSSSLTSTPMGANPRAASAAASAVAGSGSTTCSPSLTAFSPKTSASCSLAMIASGYSSASTARLPGENAGG